MKNQTRILRSPTPFFRYEGRPGKELKSVIFKDPSIDIAIQIESSRRDPLIGIAVD